MKLLILLLIWGQLSLSASDWTWAYRKNFSGSELQSLREKAHVTFTRVDIPQFQQLIFSWNAYRPKMGYFTFHAQSRDAKTKTWSAWYKMAEWGAATQQTHFVRHGDAGPVHNYVRFEQPNGHFADGFRLRVESHGQANLADLRSLNVSVSDFSKFEIEPVAQCQQLEGIQIGGVPHWSQFDINDSDNARMCSPTALSMLVSYLSPNVNVDPLEFAKKAYDHGLSVYGSWPFNTAHAFEVCPKRCFRVVRLHSFAGLHKYLKRRMPVVVSVRGYLDGAPREYKNGHLLVVIGWDPKKQMVICHDPAIEGSQSVRCAYKLAPFLRSWESSHRLAYVAS